MTRFRGDIDYNDPDRLKYEVRAYPFRGSSRVQVGTDYDCIEDAIEAGKKFQKTNTTYSFRIRSSEDEIVHYEPEPASWEEE